ncbi:MAG: macro domain-containing protein, partial [Planctomycetota bacterium]|nr:macro domain-containing protein [Planctomycetota bacterium]
IGYGDFFDANAEALVISANNWLRPGSGAAKEALDRGGPGFAEALRELQPSEDPLPHGSALVIPGFNLTDALGHRKHLIHAVTTWYTKKSGGKAFLRRIPTTPKQIYKATQASLREAVRCGAKTVAFKLMSARPGYNTVPDDLATMIMGCTLLSAINDMRPECCDAISQISLVLSDQVQWAKFLRVFPDIVSVEG